jgi:hypothetical protein
MIRSAKSSSRLARRARRLQEDLDALISLPYLGASFVSAGAGSAEGGSTAGAGSAGVVGVAAGVSAGGVAGTVVSVPVVADAGVFASGAASSWLQPAIKASERDIPDRRDHVLRWNFTESLLHKSLEVGRRPIEIGKSGCPRVPVSRVTR